MTFVLAIKAGLAFLSELFVLEISTLSLHLFFNFINSVYVWDTDMQADRIKIKINGYIIYFMNFRLSSLVEIIFYSKFPKL